MWSDREAELDLLNVQHLVAAVHTTVTSDHLLPVTVGVFGDWGSGKSTVMRLARKQIEADEEILCVPFNGWLFEGYEDAKAAILGTILDRLAEERGARENAGELFGRLVQKVNWLRVAGWSGKALMLAHGLPAFDLSFLSKVIQKASEIAEDVAADASEGPENIRRTVRDFETEFKELLEQTGVRTVTVFIDDLDRCLPSTIIDTLEAIRLFVFVPRMAFVIAADERLVRRAAREHFPGFEQIEEVDPNYPSRDVGREYLEKLIQVPVHVPPLSRAEIATYVNVLFAERHLRDDEDFPEFCAQVRDRMAGSVGNEVVFSLASAEDFFGEPPEGELAEDLALAGQLGDVLAASVDGNPRQTKRFLNALVLRLRMGEARGVELERRVAAKLLLLEYFKPGLFKSLAVWQAAQGGQPDVIRQLEGWIEGQAGPAAVRAAEGRQPDEEVEGNGGPPEEADAAEGQGEELPQELQPWIAEEWVRSWLSLDPSLADRDLTPYFFFARERIGAVGQLVAQLSPAGAQVLQQLLVPSEASHLAATRAARELSTVEASGVFDALIRHTSTTEGMQRPHSALAGMMRFVGARSEFQAQLLAFLRTLPLTSVGRWAPALVAQVITDQAHRRALESLYERWMMGDRMLQRATEMVERRLQEQE